MKETAWFVPPDKVARLAQTLDSDPQKESMVKSYRITQDPTGKQYFRAAPASSRRSPTITASPR